MSLGRCLAIANPAAKHGETGRLLSVIRTLLGPVAECDFVLSQGPEHARLLARDAEGYDTYVAVGGDGTVHEIVNGIMDKPEPDRPAFTVIPTGSGNDYARTLGISFDVPQAVRQIAGGERRRVDLGTCNGVVFANSVAIGLDARVTATAVEMKVTSGWSGLPLYLRALFHVLFTEFYSHSVRIALDGGEPREADVLALALTNGPTYGGGFKITPTAVGDDGLLDVCLIDGMSLGGALLRLPFVVLGKHTRMRPVHMSLARRLELWSENKVAGQIDGEVMLADHYDVRIMPAALTVVVPKRVAG